MTGEINLRSYKARCEQLKKRFRQVKFLKDSKSFLQLGPDAEAFYHGLHERRLNAPTHLRKILALEGVYTRQQIGEALSDAHRMSAYSSECIINLLGQRERPQHEPGPLHLTRPGDQLDIETPQADLSIYETPNH